MKISQALDVHDRSVSYREAEIFLSHILDKNRSYLHANPDHELSPAEATTFETFLARREQNEPVAYITNQKEFYGRTFLCDKRALIPRPETEGLLDLAKIWAPDYFNEHIKASNKPCPLRILELGTGSGNIAVSLGLELAKLDVLSKIIATDISSDALELAKENWERLKAEDTRQLSHLTFLEADLFAHETIRTFAPYHLIVANLPYVPDQWKFNEAAQPDVVFYEPEVALFGGKDGLDHYRNFFANVQNFIAPDGKILIEYGEDETGDITPLVQKYLPSAKLIVHKDYAELDRILEISFT